MKKFLLITAAALTITSGAAQASDEGGTATGMAYGRIYSEVCDANYLRDLTPRASQTTQALMTALAGPINIEYRKFLNEDGSLIIGSPSTWCAKAKPIMGSLVRELNAGPSVNTQDTANRTQAIVTSATLTGYNIKCSPIGPVGRIALASLAPIVNYSGEMTTQITSGVISEFRQIGREAWCAKVKPIVMQIETSGVSAVLQHGNELNGAIQKTERAQAYEQQRIDEAQTAQNIQNECYLKPDDDKLTRYFACLNAATGYGGASSIYQVLPLLTEKFGLSAYEARQIVNLWFKSKR